MEATRFTIFQGVHHEASVAAHSELFKALDISRHIGNPYYEFAIMRDLANSDTDKPWGLVSWKFEAKTGITAAEFHEFVDKNISDADVVFVNPMIFWEAIVPNVWQQGEAAHPGIVDMASRLTGIDGLEQMVMKRDTFAYCQYFVAKPQFWRDYLEFIQSTIVDPLERGQHDNRLLKVIEQSAGHHNAPDANYLPFIIERMFPTFLYNRPKYRVCAFQHGIDAYIRKFGEECGEAVVKLSELKQTIKTFGDENYDRWNQARIEFMERFGELPLATLDDPPVLDKMESDMEAMSVVRLHREKLGKTSDKWSSYLGYYDYLFSPLSGLPIRLLEIGVQNGGSLETWSKYFPNAELLVGCDVDPKCAELQYDDPRVKVVVGDVNDAVAYNAITELSSQYDVIIDDGSHVSFDIIMAFVNYFPMLRPGGLFVIEDTHTLYMNEYGGGLLNELSGYAFFKKLVDVINFEFWREQATINTYLRSFFEPHAMPQFILEGWIDSIEFRNSVITIRKALCPGHEKLGDRLVAGEISIVKNLDEVLESSKSF